MARGTTIYTQAAGSVLAYKNTYQPLSDIINAALVKTADTGQVNWGAVATEPTGIRDFETFTLGGTLQGSAPIFVRTDYRGGTLTGSGVSVTVGTSTDGAGVIGGLSVPIQPLQSHTSPSGVNNYAWAASDRESYFTFLYGLDPLASGVDGVGAVVVERTRDQAGSPAGAGFHVWRWNATSNTAHTFAGGWSKTFGAPTQPLNPDFNINTLVPDLNTINSAYVGTTSYAFPAYTYTPPFVKGASKALLFGFPTDYPRGQAVTLTHYGASMTFVSPGDAFRHPLGMMTDSTTAATRYVMPLIRWD